RARRRSRNVSAPVTRQREARNPSVWKFLASACRGRLQPAGTETVPDRYGLHNTFFRRRVPALPVPVPRRSVALPDARPRPFHRALLELVTARGVAMAAVGGRLVFAFLRRSALVRFVFGHDTRTSQETNPHWHTPCDLSSVLT